MGEGGNSAKKNLFVILEELTEKIRKKKKVVPNAQVPPIVYLQKSKKKKKKKKFVPSTQIPHKFRSLLIESSNCLFTKI